ncbi:MAG: hypothetical protein GY754_38295, partial [bacterium]|nr:hypothetical protein [bacterium]
EGRSVAASADGSTIIVGADGNDEKGSSAGAVYVYRWDGNIWSEKKIVASDGEKDDSFGSSVSISSNGNTFLVGAYGNDEEGSQAGAAYTYKWNGSSWKEEKITGGVAGENFGKSLSISSDGNSIIIGAYLNSEKGVQAGAAYLYKWNGSSWKETNKFYGKARLNYFGRSVSISPDGNSVIIGAYGNNEKGVQAGAAYLYKWSGSSWKETNKFYGEARLNYFGRSVSLSSGGSVAVVGAPGNKVGSFTSGAAYLYNWDGNSWKATKLIPDDGLSDDYFGNSISITPDGKSAIVGAPGNDGKKNNGGAAYIYKWNGSSWDEKKIMPANAQDNEGFGNSNISISADGNSVVVGATGNSDKGLNAGITYFFELEDSSWKEKKLYASDAASGDYFGGCISISSDGNTVIVGAYGNDIGEAVNKGSAYLFYQK